MKVLVVGAGLAGATIARILAENSIFVKVIDKRNHIAGNAFDYLNKNNERIHKYGPHLLHCNKNSKALVFLDRFTKWVDYEHKVRALLPDGRTTPLPINQITIEDIYKVKFNNESEVKNFLNSIRNKKLIPSNTDELFESTVGNKLADLFFRPYTKKMWGMEAKSLSLSVGARLPVRTNKDQRYFNDNFQALPEEGYTSMVDNILNHENISLSLETNFDKKMESEYDHLFLCMPIDEYYEFNFGILPYRSIIFENKDEKIDNFPSPVINFTDNSKYTRKTNWSLFPNSPAYKKQKSTATYEIPCSIKDNPGEYYYPVQTKESRLVYEKYKIISRKNSNITFCGRTGLFRYIDMIPAVEIHIKIANDFLKKNKFI